mgnify:CR=1 FL=1
MNRFNPNKLLNSKWTSTNPQHKEKHFIITKLHWDDEKLYVLGCELEAIITKNSYSIKPDILKNDIDWLQGWK